MNYTITLSKAVACSDRWQYQPLVRTELKWIAYSLTLLFLFISIQHLNYVQIRSELELIIQT